MKNNAPAIIICPACGSEEVAKEKDFSIGYVIGLFLAFVPIPFFIKKYHCIDCGTVFKNKDLQKNS